MFSCEFCEISKNTFSYRTRLVAAFIIGLRQQFFITKDMLNGGCYFLVCAINVSEVRPPGTSLWSSALNSSKISASCTIESSVSWVEFC